MRSCKRGIGHPKQAAHLPLERLANLSGDPEVSATILASWWLLRELEASRARHKHVTIDETPLKASWKLPSSKTDQAALGATRSHTCAGGLCPYHVMVDLLKCLPDEPEQLIFPAEDGLASTKKSWADTFEALAHRLHLPIVHENGARAYTGHSARVTGARFMAIHNIELWRIQLFGRWGSDVVLHYVQDAPVAQLDMLALESTATMSVRKAQEELLSLQQRIKECKTSFMQPELHMLEDCDASVHLSVSEENLPSVTILNTAKGGRYRLTLIYKLDIHPRRWRARCGWPFGKNQADYRICKDIPSTAIHLRCSKCFPKPRPAVASTTAMESDSSDGSHDPCASDASVGIRLARMLVRVKWHLTLSSLAASRENPTGNR